MTNPTQLDFTELLKAGIGPKVIINGIKAAEVLSREPDILTRQPAKPAPNRELADKLRQTADAMQRQIDQKLNPAISDLRPTARRARIADSMAAEGRQIQKVQGVLYALADLHEDSTCPKVLDKIRQKTQIEILLASWREEYPDGQYSQDERDRLARAGINRRNYQEARQAIQNLNTIPHEDPFKLKIKEAERALLSRKIPGFFPTPGLVIDQMLAHVDIHPGHTILEPSAGRGNIAEVIRELYPDNPLSVIEYNYDLARILELKGFDLVGQNFLEYQAKADQIIMNPPFGDFQDIEHVRHAYNLLESGGRLVSIMAASYSFSQKKVAQDFRGWLAEVGAYEEELLAGSFMESGTGVNARLVVINKTHHIIEEVS